jgi:hypothetical protein
MPLGMGCAVTTHWLGAMSHARTDSAKRIVIVVGLLVLALAQSTRAQVQVGDDLRMNMNGLLTLGYAGNYGDAIASNHSLEFGGSAQLNGDYYNPNFLNFTVTPYYNQSRANSGFQSLTDATGVDGQVNLFNGSRFPGFASFHYDRNSTGTFGLVGTPNFTTIGNSYGFGVGWSALLPDWPTLSVSYSQGNGNGTIYGTNELSNSSTKTLNVHSNYQWAGWRLGANYDHIAIYSSVPFFLSSQTGTNTFSTSGNDFGVNGTHDLPWHGSVSLGYLRTSYSGDYASTLSEQTGLTNYNLNQQTALISFHPTERLGLFVNEDYTSNLNAFLYQNIITGGGGIPIVQDNSNSNSFNVTSGASYNFTRTLYGTAQVTYFDQTYFGNRYSGTSFIGTVGYGRRILDIFTFSASVVDSANKYTNNSIGFVGNLNAFHNFGLWEFSGGFSYAQNVQSYLITYTTSYYNYNANLHRRLGRGMQWTGAFNGNHSGFSQNPGSTNHSESFSTSLAWRLISATANYSQSRGQSILTSSGLQPITTLGVPPEGLILYNGESWGAGIGITPISRMTLSASYAHATSETLSATTPSNNRAEVFYTQLQYRLRQITVLAGFTKFSQGVSATGILPATQYSYFAGVTRSFNFF